ncbi:MAG: leucine-rich repeat domain-containing protein [Oscillospiraceae bacterium]
MKVFKKIIGILLTAGMLVSLLGVTSYAATSDYTIKDGVLTSYSGDGGDLVIPENLGITRIEMYAFTNCQTLKSVVIPAGVVFVDPRAFIWSRNLVSITVANGNASYASVDGVLFSKDKARLITYPCGKTGGYTIPSSVTDIVFMSFAGCGGLTSVTIPEGVKAIEADAFSGCIGLTSIAIPASVTTIEDQAFGTCGSLTDITVATGNVNYTSSDGVLFTKDMTGLIRFPGGKSGSYKVPSSVRSIGYCAFEGCNQLFGITVPLGVTSIGDSAFSGCDVLVSLIISSSVARIGDNALDKCPNLTIYGKAGSYAESYAKAQGAIFSPLSLSAFSTSSAVQVNGKTVAFEAYNIYGNNYFKLRDLAKVISGTDRQFSIDIVSANSVIYLTTGKSYTPVGGELTPPAVKGSVTAQYSTWRVYLNGAEISLKAYNINGNNYFKLRDVGEAIDFGVIWNAEKSTIEINTTTGYVFE